MLTPKSNLMKVEATKRGVRVVDIPLAKPTPFVLFYPTSR